MAKGKTAGNGHFNGRLTPEFIPEPFKDWEAKLQLTKDGKPVSNEFNCAVALCHCPEFSGAIAWGVREHGIMLKRPCQIGSPGRWEDHHSATLVLWLQSHGIPAKFNQVHTAVIAVAKNNPTDELGDWLRSLPEQWDGQERIGSWLATYCGAEESEANSLMGSKFLIGAVARALEPGCRMDYMLVPEGAQGIGKSTLVRILAGPYGSENLPDFHSKESMFIASTKWFIEIPELAAIGKSRLEEVKAFISRTADTVRTPYDRHPITRKRWSVLMGSVNPDGTGYLKDTTGNRRFWPVKCGTVDTKKLQADRAQLFAEAVYCYLRGDPWWVENEYQQQTLTELQEDRVQHDEWASIMENWLENRPNVGTFSTWELAKDALGISSRDVNASVQTRIGIAMKRLGFVRYKKREGKLMKWEYRR